MGPIGIDLGGIAGRAQNTYAFANGDTFRPDLSYPTYSSSGRTLHFDEVKGVADLRATPSNLRQLAQYDRAITEVNAASATGRAIGGGLKIAGPVLGAVGVGLDAYSTYGTISAQLAAGNAGAAALSGAQFVGRQGGAVAGAWVGAALFGGSGFFAGSVAPGLGNVILGGLGTIVGAGLGAYLGEAGITALSNEINGLLGGSGFGSGGGGVGDGVGANVPPPASLGLPSGSYFIGPTSDSAGIATIYFARDGFSTRDAPDGNTYGVPNEYLAGGRIDNYGGDGGGDPPVLLDLTGKGIAITPLDASTQVFDTAGDGHQHLTAWAAPGNGVLVLDDQGNGTINRRDQVVFTAWDPSATTDMQALLDVFDTNHDGKLDAGDAKFSQFKIMVTNADGSTTLKPLAQAGVASIDLKADKTSQMFEDGSAIEGETRFTKTDGTTGTAATVSLAYDGTPIEDLPTTSYNPADGLTTIDLPRYDITGMLIAETIKTTSADGLTVRTANDTDGDGIIDTRRRDVTVVNGDGSRTRTVTDMAAPGVTEDRTTTMTSADGRTVTILRDPDGNGVIDQREVDATAGDGSKSVTVTNLAPNGTTISSTTHTVSADGQTGTTTKDLDGDGIADLKTVDTTVVGADGGTTETIVETNADGSLRDRTIKSVSADESRQVMSVDADGNGTYETVTVTAAVHNADGSVTTTQAAHSADGSALPYVVTTISADGFTTTTQHHLDGGPTVQLTHVDSKAGWVGPETITDTDVQGKLLDKKVVARYSTSTTIDSDGNGNADHIETSAFAPPTWIQTNTVSDYAADGTTLIDRSVTTSSYDGLTGTVKTDANGDGVAEDNRSTQTVKNGDGSSTTTTTDVAANGALLSKTVATTSADDLTTTSSTDANGDGLFEAVDTVSTSMRADGSRVVTDQPSSSNGDLLMPVIMTTSADRRTTTRATDFFDDANQVPMTTDVVQENADGSDTETKDYLNCLETLLVSYQATTSANGLVKTTKADSDGNGSTDLSTTDVTTLNRDGSRTETVSTYGPGTTLRDRRVTTTSATGLIVASQEDVDGNGSWDRSSTGTSVLNADGSATTTLTRSAGSTVVGRTVTTTSANGLTATTRTDLDGDGTFDTTSTDVTTLNADGTSTKTTIDVDGSIRDKVIQSFSVDGKTVTSASYLGGNTNPALTKTVTTNADGSRSTTTNEGAVTLNQTTGAQGLSTTASLNDSSGATEARSKNATTVLDADGSRTTTVSMSNKSGIAADFWTLYRDGDLKRTTTVSPDGNTVITAQSGSSQTHVTGAFFRGTGIAGLNAGVAVPTFDFGDDGIEDGDSVGIPDYAWPIWSTEGQVNVALASTDVSTVAADGSTSEIRLIKDATNTSSLEKHTVSPFGDVISDTLDVDGNGSVDVSDTLRQRLADNGWQETKVFHGSSGQVAASTTISEAKNGRSLSAERDSNGDGTIDLTERVALDPSGVQTDALSTKGIMASMASATSRSLSADGLHVIIQTDFRGDGHVDRTVVADVALASDGSIHRTATETLAGFEAAKVSMTTSANGLSSTTAIDLDAMEPLTRQSLT